VVFCLLLNAPHISAIVYTIARYWGARKTNTETLATYFNVSEAGLKEPECIRDLTWEQMNYTDIITTI